MSKAYLTGPRPIKLANGTTLRNGQIITGGNDMITPRKLNSSYPMNKLSPGTLPAASPRPAPTGDENIARAGAPKRAPVDAVPVPGQKPQSGDGVYTGPGQKPVDDEREPPMKSSERVAPVAFGMSDAQRKSHAESPSGNAVLVEAANLGRKA
jgi:hypothetical protein